MVQAGSQPGAGGLRREGGTLDLAARPVLPRAAFGSTTAADAIAKLAAVAFAPPQSDDDVPVEIVAVTSDPNLWREVTGGVALIA